MDAETKPCINDNNTNKNNCHLSICKSKISPNNNADDEHKCKTNKSITINTEICDYLNSQPIPEWIKSLKLNGKTVTNDSPKTTKQNEIISYCEHTKSIDDNVSSCKNVQKPINENVKPNELTPQNLRAGGGGCPCKSTEISHDSPHDNHVDKPLDDRNAGWGLADWGLTDKENEEVPEQDDVKLPSCKNGPKFADDNVSKFKNLKEPEAAEQVLNRKNFQESATECSSAVRKDDTESGGQNPYKSTSISHATDLQFNHNVIKPLDLAKPLSCKKDQKPAADYVSMCKKPTAPACPSTSCKDGSRNDEMISRTVCGDEKFPECGEVKPRTLCPCIRKPIKEFTWVSGGKQCPLFQFTRPCGCHCHSGSEIRKSRL